MKTVEATFSSMSESAFATPGEAIDFSKSIDRTRQKNMDLCIGRMIKGVDWHDGSFALRLDNHKVIRFGCAGGVVDVVIDDDQTNTVADAPPMPEVVLVRLNGTDVYWKKSQLLQTLQDNAIDRIQMGRSGLFLYVRNIGILAVNALIDRSTGRPFLFWEMTD